MIVLLPQTPVCFSMLEKQKNVISSILHLPENCDDLSHKLITRLEEEELVNRVCVDIVFMRHVGHVSRHEID